MASWNIPALINKISEDVPAIKALLTALFKWTDADTTDVPVGAKRLQDVAGGRQMQEYSGSAWGNVGKLMHDVDMLDGKHASTAQTADTIPVRDANGVIPGNVSGNAATATEASSLNAEYTVPVSNGGTGASSAANARASLGCDNASNINSGILDVAYGGTGSQGKNFVDLTNNQNVGGTKTFSSNLAFSGDNFLAKTLSGIANTDATRGQRSTFVICKITDSANKLFAGFEASAETDGSRRIYTNMRNRADTGWIDGPMLKELADGTVQHLTRTTAAASNNTEIASTAWVRTYCETTKKFLTSHQSLANYLTKTTNVSEMGRYIDMHYDNATSKYDYDVRFQVNSQGSAAGGGVLQIVAASVKATKFEGPLTGNVTGNCSGSSGSCTGNAATATSAAKCTGNAATATTASACSGNAATATKLATARNIDAASFNGTANIIVVPIGTILYFAAKTAPSHYLVCNGQAVSRTTYAALFALIGTTYGAGNGSSTFNVPNLIDRFPQGNATPGTVKAAGLPNITGVDKMEWYGVHSGIVNNNTASGVHTGCFNANRVSQKGGFGGGGVANGNNESTPRGIAFDASKSNAIYGKSSTVQPPALTLLPIIKAL